MNLYSYVKDPFTREASFDFDLFREHVTKAMRLMDDLRYARNPLADAALAWVSPQKAICWLLSG